MRRSRKTARAVERENRREIALRFRRAVDRPEDTALGSRNLECREGNARVRPGNADQDGCPARPAGEERAGGGVGPAGRFDRIVDAPAGRLANELGGRVGIAGPGNRGRRAELGRRRELLRGEIDGDDGLGADGCRGKQRREPDAAAADHAHTITRSHARRPPHGADSGGDRAADEGGDVERNVVGNRQARPLGDDGMVCKRREERVVVHGLTVPGKAGRSVEGGRRGPWPTSRATEVRQISETLLAVPAPGKPRQSHMGAGPKRRPRAGLDHHARPLVAEDGRAAVSAVPSIAFRSE